MIPIINIGQMSKRGVLQRPSSSTTPSGGRPRAWQDVANVWLSISSVNGREEVFGMKIQPSMTHVIVMRYRVVDTAMRIVIRSIPYNIRAVDDVELRGHKLILGVERGVAT